MPEPAFAVTDTHPLIFHAAGGSRLGSAAKRWFARADAGDAIIYVPAVVLWECALLVRVGKIALRRPIADFAVDLFGQRAYRELPLTAAHVVAADALGFTRDPFDALIVAAAREAAVPLITRDAAITESGIVRTIW